MSEPVVRRQHPLYFLVFALSWLKPLAVPALVYLVFNNRSGPLDWPLPVYGGAVGLFVLCLIFAWLSWRKFMYVRDGQQLVVTNGVLFRQQKTIHVNRIHSVQVRQPLIQRLCGVAQVAVETAGGDKKPEVVFRALSLDEARNMQALARKRTPDDAQTAAPREASSGNSRGAASETSPGNSRGAASETSSGSPHGAEPETSPGSPHGAASETSPGPSAAGLSLPSAHEASAGPSAEDADTGAVRLFKRNAGPAESAPEPQEAHRPPTGETYPAVRLRVSAGTFLQAAVTTSNLQLVAAFVAGLLSFADDLLGEDAYQSAASAAASHLSSAWAVLLWVGVALALAWLLSIVLYAWKYANFTLEGTGERISVSYGLLEKRELAFSTGKVQAVLFIEGLLRMPLGRGELRLIVVQSDKKEVSVMLHPYIRKAEVEPLLRQLLPAFRPIRPEYGPVGNAWLSFVRWKLLFAALPAGGLIAWLGWATGWPGLLLLPLAVWWGHAQHRSEGAAFDGPHLVIRHRELALQTAWMRRSHVQTLELQASIFQRRKGRRNVAVAVMGGQRSHTFRARLLPEEGAGKLWRWYSRRRG